MNSRTFLWLAAGLALAATSFAGSRLAAQERLELRDISPGELRAQAFRLNQPTAVRIEAVGAEAGGLNRLLRARNAVAGFVMRVLNQDPPRFDDGWSATGWIVNADTREVVWRLDGADARAFEHGLREFEGELELPAGTYEAWFASFPDVGWRGRNGPGWEYDHDAAARLRLDIEAEDGAIVPLDHESVLSAFEARNVIGLGRDAEETHDRIAFDLSRPTDVEVYMVGEASRRTSYDHGWIIDAKTREPVWNFDWVRSQPAGGSARNRVARDRITLPAGSYAAFFTRDGSHGPGNWRSMPPGDPSAWGLSIRPVDARDRDAFRAYAYEPVPLEQAMLSLTRVGDGEAVSEGITLDRDLDVRVFALGEGTESGMYDFASIEDARTREPVWEMKFDDTRHAGGTSKNRVFDGIVHLPAGSYIVSYVTDDSHAYDDWNGSPPGDAEFWGVTLLPASGPLDRSIVRPYDEASDPDILARIVRVSDARQVRRRFTLDEAGSIRIHAVGEGQSGEMFDYARIVDARGSDVWRMRFEDTNHAGGSRKNRVVNAVIPLDAGEYEVIYRTDDSHAYGEWNASPPADPNSWGVLVRRER